MSEKFLKARIPNALYQALQTRAAVEGKRLGTYTREVLERDEHAITTVEALTRIESVLAQSQAGNASAIASKADHETQFVLQEIRLLVRELAMVQNAQILARVAAQLKSQPHQFR